MKKIIENLDCVAQGCSFASLVRSYEATLPESLLESFHTYWSTSYSTFRKGVALGVDCHSGLGYQFCHGQVVRVLSIATVRECPDFNTVLPGPVQDVNGLQENYLPS